MRFPLLSVLFFSSISVGRGLPTFSWDRISTFAFPGIGPGCGLGKPGCVGLGATYTHEALLNYSRYKLVLVQGSNYTQFSNGTWRASQQHEAAHFATALASVARDSGRQPPYVFPYVAAYAPQAWYEAQARFNDPEQYWEQMWLRDPQGLASSMLGGAGACSTTTNEHGNYNQYSWRRLYDWRVNATRQFYVEDVLRFIREDTQSISGAFFDDWTSVAARSIQCSTLSVPCDTCKCECGYWPAAHDRAEFLDATLAALQEVIDAMTKAGKLPIISTVDGGCYTTNSTGCTGGQATNPYSERFTQGAMAMLRGETRDGKLKGWRFREAFCNQGSDLPITNWTSTTAACVHDVRYLLQQPAASTPHLVHGHGDGSNTFEFLLAAFLIVAQENWYFSCSGHSHAQDPRVPASNGPRGNEWGPFSFAWMDAYDWPLGRPLGPAQELQPLLFRRSFEHLDVEINLNCTPAQGPRNCSTFLKKQGHTSTAHRASLWQREKRSTCTDDPISTSARQVMGNDVDHTGGTNTSTTGASYIAFRIPGAVYVAQHRVLLVYAEARKYSQNDWGGQHDLTMRRSLDDGVTFGPLITIVDTSKLWPSLCPQPARNCSAVWDPSAVVDELTGRVYLFFGRAQNVWGVSTHRDSLWYVTSDDGFVTWSSPVDISSACHRCAPIGHPYPHRTIACTTPGGGHGIQASSGRLVVPLYSESLAMGTTVCVSDDGGKKWAIGKQPVNAPVLGALGALEPEVVELFDSRLMLTMRRAFGVDGAPTTWCGNGVQNCRAHAYSQDGGETWHDYTIVPQLPDPGVKAGIFRFTPPSGSSAHKILSSLLNANASGTSGALLFVNPNPKLGAVGSADWEQRIRTTLRLSLDNGHSWPFATQVESRSGYSTITSLGDGDSVALIFEDTYGTPTSRPFPLSCSSYPSPKGICDGGVLIVKVNVSELLLSGAWAAPMATKSCQLRDASRNEAVFV